MGNAKRKLDKALKNQKPVRKKDDGSHTINVVMITVAVVLSLAIVVAAAILIFSGVKDKNAKPEDLISFESKHYKVDNGMLSYFFTTNFYQFCQQYGSQLTQSGFDPSVPLSTQYIDQSNNQTYYQYIMDQTANQVMQMLYLAEGAYDDGIKMDDADNKKIDDAIASLDESAKTYGMDRKDYIEYINGKGVTEKSVRKALELTFIANKQSDALKKSFTYTDEECEKYYSENKSSLDKANIRSYEVTALVNDDMTEEQVQAAYDEAKAEADNIAAATSEQDYADRIYNYLLKKNEFLETTLDDETAHNVAQDTLAENYTPSNGTELDTWLLDSSRKAGDTTVTSSTEGTYTVSFLVTPPARDESATKTVRHILISTSSITAEEATAKKDELQEKWDASDKTEEAFEKLADEYNDDGSSLYENITKGQMVEEFENWCFDESRKPGDSGMVETQYGYHLMYFVGEGDTAWVASVKSVLSEQKMNEVMTGYQDKYKVDYDTSKIAKIADYNAYQVPDVTTIPETTEAAPETDDSADTADTAAADDTVQADIVTEAAPESETAAE